MALFKPAYGSYGAWTRKESPWTTVSTIAESSEHSYELQLAGYQRTPKRMPFKPTPLGKKRIEASEVRTNFLRHQMIIGRESKPWVSRMQSETTIPKTEAKLGRTISNLRGALKGYDKKTRKALQNIPSAIRRGGLGLSSKLVSGTNAMINLNIMKGAQKKSFDQFARYMTGAGNSIRNVLEKAPGRLIGGAGRLTKAGGLFGVGLMAVTGLSLALSKTRHGRSQ